VIEADPSVSTSSTKRGLLCLVVSLSFLANVDMINIFEVFLPQLLRYPNPADPLNGDAAVLLLREPKTYESKVRDYVSRYATREAVEEMDNSEDSEYEMSDAEMSDDDEDELAGQMELS
jgi:ubiquitin-conjugating enzyme E2 H